MESLEARHLLANFVVTSVAAEGEGSLVAAIESANQAAGSDSISFDLPDGESLAIVVTTLPAITDTVVIDGTTQPGYIDAPLITIRGIESSANGGSSGFRLQASNSVIRGLALNRFSSGTDHDGSAITIAGSNNRVEANYLGVNANGNAAAGNAIGVQIQSGSGNSIGGSAADQGNLISGNSTGIVVRSGNNRIEGNRIGTNAAGEVAVPNNVGIELRLGEGNTVGGDSIGQRNLIAGNSTGVTVRTNNNVIQGNYVGMDAGGSQPLPNATGIRIEGVSGNLIGGTTAGQQNVISGNQVGISLAGSNNQVQGNLIGTDPIGIAAIPNNVGIELDGDGNTVGGTSVEQRNIVAGNGTGIAITGNSNRLEGNYLGTDINGSFALGNGTAIQVNEGENNLIGGTAEGQGNVISGNQTGVVLVSARGSLIQGNRIGTTADGAQPLGNTDTGISILGTGAQNIRVGGSQTGAGNVISASGGFGILVNSDRNFVEGNVVGRSADQPQEFGNGSGGILVLGSNNQIGSSEAGGGNVVSGNALGINLNGARATGNFVQSNWIGTDANGSSLGNLSDGIQLAAPGNIVGGSLPGQGNIIGNNRRHGIFISGTLATQNSILGNLIGVDQTDANPLPNQGNGVHVENTGVASGNRVGGNNVEEGNRIQFNGGAGVAVVEPGDGTRRTTGTQIRFNSISRNIGIGIDLGPDGFPDGITPNDPGDLDTGPNELQNFPLLEGFRPGPTTRLIGSLDSQPGMMYRIDFYVNPAADEAGEVEGERFLGSIVIGPDNLTFDIELDAATQVTDLISAAATSISDDGFIQGTSEFSPLATVSGTKFNDLRADGPTADDPPFADYEIQLYFDDGDGVLDTTLDTLLATAVTDEQGQYAFRGVGPGRHFVVEGADERVRADGRRR